jgi:hypothetical protein
MRNMQVQYEENMEYGFRTEAEQNKIHDQTSTDVFVKQQSEMYGSSSSR